MYQRANLTGVPSSLRRGARPTSSARLSDQMVPRWLPLMISHFHRFSVVSPLANVIESLLMFVLMVAGAIYLFVYAVSASFAGKLAVTTTIFGDAAASVIGAKSLNGS